MPDDDSDAKAHHPAHSVIHHGSLHEAPTLGNPLEPIGLPVAPIRPDRIGDAICVPRRSSTPRVGHTWRPCPYFNTQSVRIRHPVVQEPPNSPGQVIIRCTRRDNRPFAFAGLRERWEKGSGEPIESCTIITTEANELLAEIHDRMPVILHPADYGRWLDLVVDDPEELEPLIAPFPAETMGMKAVSTIASNARNETADCLTPREAS